MKGILKGGVSLLAINNKDFCDGAFANNSKVTPTGEC
jgi:hypothetical protein